MRKHLFVYCIFFLCSITACKKVCYQCNQYCAYCVNPADSTIAHKICSTSLQGNPQVDAILTAYEDSGYVCNLLNQQIGVCDNKNSVDKAITYYEQENYYCNPQ